MITEGNLIRLLDITSVNLYPVNRSTKVKYQDLVGLATMLYHVRQEGTNLKDSVALIRYRLV